MIERQLFIKDLFNSKYILNSFNQIEFENFKTFIECVQKDTLDLNKNIRCTIPINTVEEIDVFVELASESYLCERTMFNLILKNDLIKDFFDRVVPLKNKKYEITMRELPKHRLKELNEETNGFGYWTKHNPLWIELDFNYENMEDIITLIVETFMNVHYRFYKINFDYESFDKMKVKELHKLEFWLHQIRWWRNIPQTNSEEIQPIILFNRVGRTIFVSRDFKLYITRKAFEDGNMLFDLGKHYKDNGETIPFLELNKLRSYTDLNIAKNPFVDYYQNLKIMGHINEIPYITRIISKVLLD